MFPLSSWRRGGQGVRLYAAQAMVNVLEKLRELAS
jgi:hypothetical protein